MTFFDWLNTNDGHTFLLAVIGLMNAGSYYLWWLSHRDRADLRNLMNGHLQEHMKGRNNGDTSGPGSS